MPAQLTCATTQGGKTKPDRCCRVQDYYCQCNERALGQDRLRTHELARKRTRVVSVLCDKTDLGEFFFVSSVRFSFLIHSKLGSASLWVSRSPNNLARNQSLAHGREDPICRADLKGMVSALLKATYSESVRLVHQTLSLGDELTTPLFVLGHGVNANGYHWQLYLCAKCSTQYLWNWWPGREDISTITRAHHDFRKW